MLHSCRKVGGSEPQAALAPPVAPAEVERAVEVVTGADQRQVRECLREVAERLPRPADLLGVEADVVRIGEHLLERKTGLFEAPRPRARLDVPDGPDRDR